MVHPYTHSIVKLRDNGAIDIFVGTHQGIRIDPNTQTVNICANTLKEHLGALRAWVTGDAKTECATGYELRSHAHVTIHATGDVTIKTDSNAQILVAGNMDVNVGGETRFKSGGNMHFTAPNYYFD